jgi:hypothetical protein
VNEGDKVQVCIGVWPAPAHIDAGQNNKTRGMMGMAERLLLSPVAVACSCRLLLLSLGVRDEEWT